jgi:hypothetical protein
MSGMGIFETWLVAFLTLALFSFMYKDNPIYRIAEHIFAGLTAGYQVGLIWDTVIIQQLWDPMLGGRWWLFVPGVLGFLMFTRFSSKLSWVSRTSLAFVMGTTAGIFLISELHGRVLPQMQDTMIPMSEKVNTAVDPYASNVNEFMIVDTATEMTESDTTGNIGQIDTLATLTVSDTAAVASATDTSSTATIPTKYPYVLPGSTRADTSQVMFGGHEPITLSAEFVDTASLSFGQYYSMSFEVRHQESKTTYPLARSTVYGADDIKLTTLNGGRHEASYTFVPNSRFKAGEYDVEFVVERRSIMFLLSIIVVVGVLSTLIYFYFSHEHTGVLGGTARVGIWFIMISFGAHFGYTVMGRVSLLIGRVQFLIEDWIRSFL